MGSGGAKGMAHLGFLQALSENGIQADIYCGTSAGSIVGALCARGYAPADIVSLLTNLQYGGAALTAMLSGSLEPLFGAVDDALGGVNIEELSKPFCAIATDTANGGEVRLKTGNAARAVLASSSIPPLFRGMKVGDKVLADGAFCNAIPGDAARELGADIVIGVALSPVDSYRQTEFTCSSGESVLLRQSGFSQCDLLFEPDLTAFRATDIQYALQIYDAGYECAQKNMSRILQVCRGAASRKRI